MNAPFRFLALGFITAIALTAADTPALPQTITPQDPKLHFTGRWDTATPASPRCEWTSCGIEISGTISKLNAVLVGKPGNAFEVIVDGKPVGTVTLVADQKVYPLATGLGDGAHAITLFKRTESWAGAVQFQGFQVPAEAVLSTPEVPTRRVEFLGDSITCGYGNEAANQKEHFTLATENAWLAWGAVAARELKAELAVEAISGIWLQDNGKKKALPAIWGQTLPFSSTAAWDFAKWQADAVVVNLGTNDSGNKTTTPAIQSEPWKTAYRAFIKDIRKAYPNAHIFLTIGSMGHGPEGIIPKLNDELVAELAKEGETKVHAVAIHNQDPGKNGVGADWHPSVKTDQLMGEQIAAEIRTALKW